ncbi:alkaline phosphatase [Deinococcus puniceus]|uniref:Alkaline phosphatase n=1 Tax=Deinococcus puniceus TaxID=1182568 RepID=A0A172TCG5_9DEIO|nr:alkaline phosphatase [Deinococcus puniceus]
MLLAGHVVGLQRSPTPPPLALSTSYADSEFRAPFALTLKASVPEGHRVQWEFGDGRTATELEVQHIYYQPGVYTYRVKSFDGHGKPGQTISRTVTIQSSGAERAEVTLLLGAGRVRISTLGSVAYAPGTPRLHINDREISPQFVSVPDGPHRVSVSIPGSAGLLERTLSFTMAPLYGSSDFEQEVLELTNAARAGGWNCDTQQSGGPALPPLTRNTQLDIAATAQSAGMALAGYFSHDSTLDGSTPLRRVQATGISVRRVAENIAAGQATPSSVIDSWLFSQDHCADIMGEFTLIGLSYVNRPDTNEKTYWTQVFGRP